jgi:aurora kinase A
VLKGEEYNEKADIWGLGIVTYELAFGRVPFSILSQSDLMKIVPLLLSRSKIQFTFQSVAKSPKN